MQNACTLFKARERRERKLHIPTCFKLTNDPLRHSSIKEQRTCNQGFDTIFSEFKLNPI